MLRYLRFFPAVFGIAACGLGGSDENLADTGENEEEEGCDSSLDCDDDLFCYREGLVSECEEIFDRQWEIIIVSGTADTEYNWDLAGGAPDPYVFVRLGDDACMTSTESDSFFPAWNESCEMVVPSGGTLEVEMYDDDVDQSDTMLTFSASGNDELADIVRREVLTLISDIASVEIRFLPGF